VTDKILLQYVMDVKQLFFFLSYLKKCVLEQHSLSFFPSAKQAAFNRGQ